MKVLIAVNEWTTLVNFRHELVEALIRQGYEIIIAAPYDSRLDTYTDIGCKLINVNLDRRGTAPFNDLKLCFRYFQIIKLYKPDCVLTYTIKPNVYASIAARVLNIPRINTVTGLGAMLTGGKLVRNVMIQLQKLAMNSSNCIFYQNGFNMRFLQKSGVWGKSNILVSGSGVNLCKNCIEKYPESGMKTKFLFVSRIMRDKGIFELIEAIKLVKNKYDIQVDILGSYEAGHNYYEQLQQWIADGLVVYHGQQKDVHSFIKQAHCLIHPSYHEGMSNVCMEAAATGRPVLASNINGCKEIVEEGVTGFLFNPTDILSLTNTMIKFIELPYEQKRNMGINARTKMEKAFDRQKVVDVYISEIQRIVFEKKQKD